MSSLYSSPSSIRSAAACHRPIPPGRPSWSVIEISSASASPRLSTPSGRARDPKCHPQHPRGLTLLDPMGMVAMGFMDEIDPLAEDGSICVSWWARYFLGKRLFLCYAGLLGLPPDVTYCGSGSYFRRDGMTRMGMRSLLCLLCRCRRPAFFPPLPCPGDFQFLVFRRRKVGGWMGKGGRDGCPWFLTGQQRRGRRERAH